MSPSPPKSWPPPPPSPRFLNESLMYTVVATTGIDDCCRWRRAKLCLLEVCKVWHKARPIDFTHSVTRLCYTVLALETQLASFVATQQFMLQSTMPKERSSKKHGARHDPLAVQVCATVVQSHASLQYSHTACALTDGCDMGFQIEADNAPVVKPVKAAKEKKRSRHSASKVGYIAQDLSAKILKQAQEQQADLNAESIKAATATGDQMRSCPEVRGPVDADMCTLSLCMNSQEGILMMRTPSQW